MTSAGPERLHAAPAVSPAEALKAAVRKLIDILQDENEVLTGGPANRHDAFTERKNQALRELMAAQPAQISADLRRILSADINQLKPLLARNAWLLKTHIAALGEVTDLMIACLRAAESDGTYSRRGALPPR